MQNYTQEQIDNFLVTVEEQINELFNRRSTPESNNQDIYTYESDNICYEEKVVLKDLLGEYNTLTSNLKSYVAYLIKVHI